MRVNNFKKSDNNNDNIVNESVRNKRNSITGLAQNLKD